MTAWWEDPDPYTYEKIGTHYTGRPVYVVSKDGIRIGIIEPVEVDTDSHIAGTRLRRLGKGRPGFCAVGPTYGIRSGIARDRRRDAARDLNASRTWTDEQIDAYIERLDARKTS